MYNDRLEFYINDLTHLFKNVYGIEKSHMATFFNNEIFKKFNDLNLGELLTKEYRHIKICIEDIGLIDLFIHFTFKHSGKESEDELKSIVKDILTIYKDFVGEGYEVEHILSEYESNRLYSYASIFLYGLIIYVNKNF